MRKIFLILGFIFTLLSVILTVLPFDSLAFAPIIAALVCIFIAYYKSDSETRKWPKILFTIAYLCAIVVFIKIYFFKDEIAVDNQFEQQKIETKQEAKKELEELEGLE